ncbi:cytochrome P450 [Streptomyces rubradiris]|uniref:Cytochrome P450 n=1 Tax=Streptomyces rubradiris TaxID=285531 RepID=Q2PC61_STRRR|nr:cytochrome P450 [Streptomyces rubradiris]GHH30893.1 cytochrome P450 [Streptomyces rubradiris]GHI52660.1 cytochrome P450 [Streptomyces rubradiris]CAI94704.1 putative cytochrome P450 [Streptomyces rubradiris]
MTEGIPEPISYLRHWDRTEPFDPPAVLGELVRTRPLARMVYPDGHVGWLATSHELAREVLGSQAFSHRFHTTHAPVTKKGEIFPSVPIVPGGFIHMDPPEHTRYRNLLSSEFSARATAAYAPRVAELAAAQLAQVRQHGSPVDLLPTYVRPLSLRVLCEVLGVPFTGSPVLSALSDSATDDEVSLEAEREAGTRAYHYLLDLVGKARVEPGENVTGRLAADPELTDREITNMLLIVFAAGFASCEGALASSLLALLHHRDQLDRLRSAARSGGADGIEKMVEELLRYTSVNQFQIFRTALSDVELGGELVREGETVTVALPAANRDPARFGCPDGLDVSQDASAHLAFGYGVHACVGQRLARLVLAEGLTALVLGFPGLALDVPLREVPVRLKTPVLGVLRLPVRY